jgi:hypothetical protein
MLIAKQRLVLIEKISGRVSQGAWGQEEVIGGKVPVVK